MQYEGIQDDALDAIPQKQNLRYSQEKPSGREPGKKLRGSSVKVYTHPVPSGSPGVLTSLIQQMLSFKARELGFSSISSTTDWRVLPGKGITSQSIPGNVVSTGQG